jgi:hypothetical protein
MTFLEGLMAQKPWTQRRFLLGAIAARYRREGPSIVWLTAAPLRGVFRVSCLPIVCLVTERAQQALAEMRMPRSPTTVVVRSETAAQRGDVEMIAVVGRDGVNADVYLFPVKESGRG